MAYRQPNDRRDRTTEVHATSYLDDFLEIVEPLQSSTRSNFAEIAQLEDRINTTLADAQGAADEAVRRATSKVAIESVRRQYHEFIHLQASATEFSDKKVALAASSRDSVRTVIAEINKRLAEFETQLRKEGRWPSASPPSAGGRAVAPTTVAKSEKNTPAPRTPVLEQHMQATTRGPLKTRRRDTIPANPATPRAAALAAARAAAAAAVSSPVDEDEDGDIVIEDEKEVHTEPKEEAVVDGEQTVTDGTLYCTCRQPSAGEMVACEGKKCKIEWFHFACVGLKEAPKGTWYCPSCSTDKRRKGVGRRKQQS